MNTNHPLKKNKLLPFFVLTYVIFWILLGITGFAISLGISPALQYIFKNICAWSPTFAVFILFKKLYPQKSLFLHIKDNFTSKIQWQMVLFVILLQLAVFFGALVTYSIVNKVSFSSIEFVALPSILPLFIVNITSGPLGEELGWRGFAYNDLRVKYSYIKTAVIIGLVWGLWHFPLWLLSGYQGMELVVYILVFMVSIIEMSILIALFYDANKNLFFPILVHFLNNFLLTLVKVDLIQLFLFTAIFNALAIFVVMAVKTVQSNIKTLPAK